MFYNCYYFLKFNETEATFQLERQIDLTMKLLARILPMCILRCKIWTMEQAMKLLDRLLLMCTPRCRTRTRKIFLMKESSFILENIKKSYAIFNNIKLYRMRNNSFIKLYAMFILHLTMFTAKANILNFL